nr:DNA polymerase III subunit delta' [Rheinheimera maricola]
MQQLLHSARLAHGLLFIGPAGIGKTELANWLSAALLCTNTQKPCGGCKSCLLRQAGSHADFLVIDSSGSSIGVDAVRQLSVFMQGRAQQQQHKVVLLTQAEKLTEAAANALLKTLEEPPENSFLLLLTQASSALPATLLSRCQQWQLAAQFGTEAQQWLAAQSNRPVAEFLLPYCGGGPLQALAMLESGEADNIQAALYGLAQFVAGQQSLEQTIKQLDFTSSLARLFGWFLRQHVLPAMIGRQPEKQLALQQLYGRFSRDESQILGQNKALALSAFLCELKRLHS